MLLTRAIICTTMSPDASVLMVATGITLEVQGPGSIYFQFVPNEGEPEKFATHDVLRMAEFAHHLFPLLAATKPVHPYNAVL